jgi:DNA-directed RNA polymerase subunit RPC12/RpoP
MPIPYTCPYCRTASVATDDQAAGKIFCPNCNKPLFLPGQPERLIGRPAPADAPQATPATQPVSFFCPKCQQGLSGAAGDKIFCPKCGQKVQVPEPRVNKTVLGSLDAPEPVPVLTVVPDQPAPPFQGIPQINVHVNQQPGYQDPRPWPAPPPVYMPPPRPRGFACPYCGSREPPIIRERLSDSAWIVFVILLVLVITAPLCWIPFVTMYDRIRYCYDCDNRLN